MYKVVTELLAMPVRVEKLINDTVKSGYDIDQMFPTPDGRVMIIAREQYVPGEYQPTVIVNEPELVGEAPKKKKPGRPKKVK